MTVKFLFSLILGGSGFLLWFWFCKCLKNNLFEKEHEKKRVERFCFGLLSLLGLELTRAKLLPAFDFFYLSSKKREREKIFFFQLSCVGEFLCFKNWLSFHVGTLDVVQQSFGVRFIFFLLFSFTTCFVSDLYKMKRKTKLDFLFHGERKKMVHICFIEIKLSNRRVSLRQLSLCQLLERRWLGSILLFS